MLLGLFMGQASSIVYRPAKVNNQNPRLDLFPLFSLPVGLHWWNEGLFHFYFISFRHSSEFSLYQQTYFQFVYKKIYNINS
jgi:hypothetical protein